MSKPILIRLSIVIALGLKFIIFYFLLLDTGFVDNHYIYFYENISYLQSCLFGWINLPFGDILYVLLFFIIIFWLFNFFRLLKKEINLIMTKTLNSFIVILSIIFIFYYLWGFNYYREDISKSLNIDTSTVNEDDIINLGNSLVKEVNNLRDNMKQDDKGQLISTLSKDSIFKLSYKLYDNSDYSFISYNKPNIKLSFFSNIISSFGVTGYYNPFTGEANINNDIPNFMLPFTSCHEIFHQKGFAKEQDCNLMAFLICYESENIYFRYSSYLSVLRYALRDIYFINKKEYQRLLASLKIGVKNDINQIKIFFENKRSTILDFIFEKIFNIFLKINNQKDGIMSYNKVIKLLTAKLKNN